MNRYLISAYFLVLAFTVLTCEKPTEIETTGKIGGTVIESSTSQKMSNATITTDPITSTQFTDSQGAFLVEGVEPGIFTVKATKEGYFDNTVTVNVVAGESVSSDIQLSPLSPELSVSNNSINFGTVSTTQVVNVLNSGIGTLTWNAVWSANWLTINPSSGSSTSETDVLTLTVDRTGLGFGNFNETVTITSNVNNETIDILMTISNPNAPQLSAFPLSLDYGKTEDNLTFNISNTGSGTLTWNITDNQAWISYDINSGTTGSEIDVINVSINRLTLTPGIYTGIITVSSDGGNQSVSVSMEVPDEPLLSVTPKLLNFESSVIALSFDIANAGSGSLDWTVSDNQNWIENNPTEGSGFSTVNVTVSRDGLSPGDYSGLITVISTGGNKDVEIAMNVPEDQPPTASELYDPTEITSASMKLSWETNGDADFFAYHLYRDNSATVDDNSSLVTTINNRYTTEYIDVGLSGNTPYYYKLYSEDLANQKTGGNVVNATTRIQQGTWGLNETVSVDLWGLDAFDDNLAYVVGDEGKIYKWNGSLWTEESSPTTFRLWGVGIINEDDVWLVGESGVYHYDGALWTQSLDAPTEACYSIDVIDANHVFVGSAGKVFNYINGSWSTSAIGTEKVHDISMLDSASGWLIRDDDVFSYNGFGWSHITSVYSWTNPRTSVKAFSENNVWLGTNRFAKTSNNTFFWDGDTAMGYTLLVGSDDNDIQGIDGYSLGDVWFVGHEGNIFNWDGTEHTAVNSPTDNNLTRIRMYSATDGWAIGRGGVILRYH